MSNLEPSKKTSNSSGNLVTLFLLIAFIVFFGLTVLWGYGSHKTCTNNFEGGCGYAQGIAWILSLFTALNAIFFGNFLVLVSKKYFAFDKKTVNVFYIVVNLPVLYLAWCGIELLGLF